MPPAPNSGPTLRRMVCCGAIMLAIHFGVAVPALLGIVSAPGLAPGYAAAGASVLLAAALVMLSTVDWLTFRLPDAITLPLVVAGLVVHWDAGHIELIWRLSAAMVGFAVLFAAARSYEHIRGRSGLGLGDAKLFAAAGAWVGFAGLPSVMVYAAFAALLGVAVSMLRGNHVTLTTRLPFGPFLAVALWIVWIYGPLGAVHAN